MMTLDKYSYRLSFYTHCMQVMLLLNDNYIPDVATQLIYSFH